MVQLPEREEEADKRKVHHRSGVRGGQQLPRESAGVHAQGEADPDTVMQHEAHSVYKYNYVGINYAVTWLTLSSSVGFSSDAEDLAGLLSVHCVSVQNHAKPADV